MKIEINVDTSKPMNAYLVKFKGIKRFWLVIAQTELQAKVLVPYADLQSVAAEIGMERLRESCAVERVPIQISLADYLRKVKKAYQLPTIPDGTTPSLVMMMFEQNHAR